MADTIWDQAINGYNRGPAPAPAIPPVDLSALENVQVPEPPVGDTPIVPTATQFPTSEMLPAGDPGPGGFVAPSMPTAPTDVAPAAPAEDPYQAPKTFDDSVQDYGQQAREQGNLVRQQAEIQAQGLEKEAELYTQRALELRDQEKRQAELKKVHAEEYTNVENDWRKLHDENAKTEIEYRPTTQAKIAGALALVGAGLADGLARMGGNNGTQYLQQAQANIDRAVQLDLQRQKENLANKKDAEKSKYSELTLARAKLGDTPEAEALANALIAQRYGAEVKAQSAKSQSEAMRTQGAVLGENVETQAAETIAKLKQADHEQRMRSRVAGSGAGGGGSGLGAGISVQDILDRGDKGTLKNQKELDYYLKLDANRDKDKDRETKVAATEKKAKDAEAAGELDIIANYEVIPGTAGPSKTVLAAAAKQAAGVSGLREAGNTLANLYSQIEAADKAGDTERADQLRAEYGSAAGNWLIMKSLASGQGVVNEADARRDAQEGAAPPPPGAPKAWAAGFAQKFNGISPGAKTIREINAGLIKTGQAQMEGYNLRPKSAKATGNGIPADTAKPKAASAAPSGKVAVIRVSDGAKGYLSAADAADKIATGKYKAAL